MNYTVSEVLEFIKENDAQFVRLAFCDLFGTQKNISIMPDELPGAFENGVLFDASSIKGFGDVTKSDLLLFPLADTLTVLPWRPGPGRVVRFYCDVRRPDGSMFPGNSRFILRRVVERCENLGYSCKIGAEGEFYLFKTDENGDGVPVPMDKGGYLDVSPLDKGENIRREICLCLEEMGIKPESSHHEHGPGQNEIDFRFGNALSCADDLLTFKYVVKAIASRNGLFASFMPKPLADAAGSGMHINLSLNRNGINVFKNAPGVHSAVAESFIAGILKRAPELSVFLNPLTNSYERLGKLEAPKYVSWSHQNRSQLIRIPAASGEKVRMELRSPDGALNPYLSFALLIAAGLEGIENDLKLPPAIDLDLYAAREDITASLARLPEDLEAAIALAQDSELIKSVMGEALLEEYLDFKRREAKDFAAGKNKWNFYMERYFELI